MMAVALAINVTSSSNSFRNGVVRGSFSPFRPVLAGALTYSWWHRVAQGGFYAWTLFVVASVLVVLKSPLSDQMLRFEARLARLMILSLIPIVVVCMWLTGEYARFHSASPATPEVSLVGMVLCVVTAALAIRQVNRARMRLPFAS